MFGVGRLEHTLALLQLTGVQEEGSVWCALAASASLRQPRASGLDERDMHATTASFIADADRVESQCLSRSLLVFTHFRWDQQRWRICTPVLLHQHRLVVHHGKLAWYSWT